MPDKKPFYVDGMTVQQILEIPPSELAKLNQRDLSRALRTVALAANKRINRLLKETKKTSEGYVPKKTSVKSIATDALNWVTNDGKTPAHFGVKSAKTYNQMSKQFATIRQFMSMQSSTVSGAARLNNLRFKRMFGDNFTKQIKQAKSKTAKQTVLNKFTELSKEGWKAYRRFLELNKYDVHALYEGSESIINFVANLVIDGSDFESAATIAYSRFTQNYEEQERYQNDLAESLFNTDSYTDINDYWSNT